MPIERWEWELGGWVGLGVGLGLGLVSYAIARWPRWTTNNLHISSIELHPEKYV